MTEDGRLMGSTGRSLVRIVMAQHKIPYILNSILDRAVTRMLLSVNKGSSALHSVVHCHDCFFSRGKRLMRTMSYNDGRVIESDRV